MIATINGVTVMGTPEEILEYQRLQQPKQIFKDVQPTFFKVMTEQANTQQGKCPNEGQPCFCTGACMTNGATTNAKPVNILQYLHTNMNKNPFNA